MEQKNKFLGGLRVARFCKYIYRVAIQKSLRTPGLRDKLVQLMNSDLKGLLGPGEVSLAKVKLGYVFAEN
jgi:hypothetical protein